MKKEELDEASNLLEKRRRENLASGVMETCEAMLRRLGRMEEKLGALTGEKKSPAEEKDGLFQKLRIQEARVKRLLEENEALKDERDQGLKAEEGLRKSLNEKEGKSDELREACDKLKEDLRVANEVQEGLRKSLREEAEKSDELREAFEKLEEDLREANEERKKLKNESKKFSSRLKYSLNNLREEHDEVRDDLERQKSQLEGRVEYLTGQKRDLEGKNRELKENLQNLREEKGVLAEELARKEKLLLEKESLFPAASAMDELSFSELASRISTACGLQMVQCLQLIGVLAGERVVILPEAFESARAMGRFSQKERMISLLSKLVFSYTEKYFEGGDNLAREVFTTKEYSAQDSQTTQNTGKASVRQPRTALYEGARVGMTQHLKIGVADNRHFCLRVYFFMDKAHRRPVIGYFGSHPEL